MPGRCGQPWRDDAVLDARRASLRVTAFSRPRARRAGAVHRQSLTERRRADLRVHGDGVKARFASAGGLKEGAPVRLAGVEVGQVKAVHLAGYVAESSSPSAVRSSCRRTPSRRSERRGLLGNTYMALTPGGSLEDLRPGDLVAQTEPAIDLNDVLARYAFGHKDEGPNDDRAAGGANKKKMLGSSRRPMFTFSSPHPRPSARGAGERARRMHDVRGRWQRPSPRSALGRTPP